MRKIPFTLLMMLTPLSVFAAAAVPNPVVQAATIDHAKNQVKLAGAGFMPGNKAPLVIVAGSSLKVDSFTNSRIIATLPANIPAATFRLTAQNSLGDSYDFDFTYGATSPQGPAGAVGQAGARGPHGAQGLEGPAGTSGPQGPKGPAGARVVLSFALGQSNGPVTLPYQSQALLVGVTLQTPACISSPVSSPSSIQTTRTAPTSVAMLSAQMDSPFLPSRKAQRRSCPERWFRFRSMDTTSLRTRTLSSSWDASTAAIPLTLKRIQAYSPQFKCSNGGTKGPLIMA